MGQGECEAHRAPGRERTGDPIMGGKEKWGTNTEPLGRGKWEALVLGKGTHTQSPWKAGGDEVGSLK